jgi:hypothetical protein
MPYKLLGYSVWKAARWYLRRRYGVAPRRAGIAALGALAAAGTALARRRAEATE